MSRSFLNIGVAAAAAVLTLFLSTPAQAVEDWTSLVRPALERSWGIDAAGLSVVASASSASARDCLEGASDQRVLRISPGLPTSEASAWIEARHGTRRLVCRVRVRIDGLIPALLALHALEIGQPVARDDLQSALVPLSLVRYVPLHELPVDAVAVVAVQAGEPVSKMAIRQRPPITAGQPVRVQAAAGSARVEVVAVAMTDGALGQVASFKTGNGDTVRARISGAGEAEVLP